MNIYNFEMVIKQNDGMIMTRLSLTILLICVSTITLWSQEIPANDSFNVRFDHRVMDSLTAPNNQDLQIIKNHLSQLQSSRQDIYVHRIYFTMHAIPEAVSKLRYENASNRIKKILKYDVKINAGFGEDVRQFDNTLDVVFEYAQREPISKFLKNLKQIDETKYWKPSEDGLFLTQQGALVYLPKNSAKLPSKFGAGDMVELRFTEGNGPQHLIGNAMHTMTSDGTFSPVYVNKFYALFDGEIIQPKSPDLWIIIMPGEEMQASFRAKADTLTNYTADQNSSKFWKESAQDPIILSGLLHLIENGDTSKIHALKEIIDLNPKAFDEISKQRFEALLDLHVKDIQELQASFTSAFADAGYPSFYKIYGIAQELFSSYNRPYSKENQIIYQALKNQDDLILHEQLVNRALFEIAKKSLQLSLESLKEKHKDLYKQCLEIYDEIQLEQVIHEMQEEALIYRSIDFLVKQELFEAWQVLAAYPNFMRSKEHILGKDGLGRLLGWHNLFYPHEIYMRSPINRRDNQESIRNLTERPMYACRLQNGWNAIGKTMPRVENPTLVVEFQCAEYGQLFFYAPESGAIIIPREIGRSHFFSNSLDSGTEGYMIAFYMANSRAVMSVTPAEFRHDIWSDFDFKPLSSNAMYTKIAELKEN